MTGFTEQLQSSEQQTFHPPQDHPASAGWSFFSHSVNVQCSTFNIQRLCSFKKSVFPALFVRPSRPFLQLFVFPSPEGEGMKLEQIISDKGTHIILYGNDGVLRTVTMLILETYSNFLYLILMNGTRLEDNDMAQSPNEFYNIVSPIVAHSSVYISVAKFFPVILR